ncbi:MAG: hypothetical protein WEE20_03790 [Bacteroidota bacterium]
MSAGRHGTQQRYPQPPATDSSLVTPVLQAEELMQRFSRPPGKVYLLYGDRPVFDLSMNIASTVVSEGGHVVVADGGNRFNAHAIIRFAQYKGRNPDDFLRSVFVSRSFTCYQMEQTIVHRLPEICRRQHVHTALILGLLDTFYDEQAPLREVRQILVRVLATLHELKQTGVSLLLACTNRQVWPEERNTLLTTLKGRSDRVYRLDVRPEVSQLILEQEEHTIPIIHRNGNAVPPAKGGDRYGTHHTDLHEHHRQRDRRLVEVPAGTPQGRPGTLR